MASLAVVICTHNPRAAYLERVVAAIEAQTRPADDVVVVDNASANPVMTPFRTVRESELGLVPARIRGIAETTAEVVVFVDDDNVLDPGYLEAVADIAENWPMIGVWGAAVIEGEFEVEPSPAARKRLDLIAIRDGSDLWSKLPYPHSWMTAPYGAGMAARREVAEAWAGTADPRLLRAEDVDLAFTAPTMGLGCGVFRSMRITHLIPAGRVAHRYLFGLERTNAHSLVVLEAKRGSVRRPDRLVRSLIRKRAQLRRADLFDWRMHFAWHAGQWAAWRDLHPVEIPEWVRYRRYSSSPADQ